MTDKEINVMISSAGRRGYLARWFRHGLEQRGTPGRVIIADADPYAASGSDADIRVELPSFRDHSYTETLLEQCKQLDVSLLISVNDHELSTWSNMARDSFDHNGTQVITLEAKMQAVVEDKYRSAILVRNLGLSAPRTVLAYDLGRGTVEPFTKNTSVVIKHRFGSGSLGMVRCPESALKTELERARRDVRDRLGRLITDEHDAQRSLIVQEVIDGTEFGLDIINDFDRNHAGTLARQKIGMRGGETDQAVSVESGSFDDIARRVSVAAQHRGAIDVDVLVDIDDKQWVIDINPRFGGGYPFSHIAGADVPSCYLAWLAGETIQKEWLEPDIGVVSSKYQDVTCVMREAGLARA